MASLLVAIAWWGNGDLQAQKSKKKPTMSQLRAELVWRAIKYARWPEDSLRLTGGKYVVVIDSRVSYAKDLKRLLAKKTLGKKRFATHIMKTTAKKNAKNSRLVKTSHVLVFSKELRVEKSGLFKTLENSSTLTVATEVKGFAVAGGMVELKVVNGKYRYLVNKGATDRAKVSLKSRMLKYSIIVDQE